MAENTASTAESTEHSTGPMGESAPRQAKNFWPSIKRLFSLLAPYKRRLWAVAAMNIVCIFLAVVAPKVMGKAMDVIFAGVISRNLPLISPPSKPFRACALRARTALRIWPPRWTSSPVKASILTIWARSLSP